MGKSAKKKAKMLKEQRKKAVEGNLQKKGSAERKGK